MNFSTNRNAKNTFISYDGKIDLLSVLVAKMIMSKTGVNIIVKRDCNDINVKNAKEPSTT